MRTKFLPLLAVTVCACASFLITDTAYSQAAKATGSKPSFDDLLSPEFSGGKQKAFRPKSWLEMEAGFTLEMRPEPPSKTAERVLVKWYVAVKNPEKRGFLLLTKDVTHVNVPLNEEIFSSVYLSPASILRITGSNRGGKGAVEMVGYEILVNGVKVGEGTSKGQPGWWNATSENLSRSETVPLLNKMETPFATMWWDRYAEILVERR